MPRVNLGPREDPRIKEMKKELNGRMKVAGLTQKELAKALKGVKLSEATMSRRMDDVGSLTLAEYCAIDTALKRRGA